MNALNKLLDRKFLLGAISMLVLIALVAACAAPARSDGPTYALRVDRLAETKGGYNAVWLYVTRTYPDGTEKGVECILFPVSTIWCFE